MTQEEIMQRIIVGLRNKNGKFFIPKFSDCLLDFFGKDINSVIVKCSVENRMLVLSESEEGHELRHSPACPIKLSANEEHNFDESKTGNIALAACVVIESSDSHVLLTRRASHMRASPNVWVLPGGHLEFGETVFEGGFREIKEETALDISSEKASILGLWENVFPLLLGRGKPKYHTLVVYLHARLGESYEEITKRIVPDPEEVDAFCWVNKSIMTKIYSGDESIKCEGKQFVFENGKTVERNLDYCSMFNKWLRLQPEPYSAVHYGLRKWMEKINSLQKKSKY